MSDMEWKSLSDEDAVRVMTTAISDGSDLLNNLSADANLGENAYRLIRFAHYAHNFTDAQLEEVIARIIDNFDLADAINNLSQRD